MKEFDFTTLSPSQRKSLRREYRHFRYNHDPLWSRVFLYGSYALIARLPLHEL